MVVGALIGNLIGGLIAMYLLASLWEWALFKRIMDDPVAGKVAAVVTGWLTAGTVAGFGMADGGDYAWRAFGLYAIPAMVVGVMFYRRGLKIREEDADIEHDEGLADTSR
jgi:hypothetical protein